MSLALHLPREGEAQIPQPPAGTGHCAPELASLWPERQKEEAKCRLPL